MEIWWACFEPKFDDVIEVPSFTGCPSAEILVTRWGFRSRRQICQQLFFVPPAPRSRSFLALGALDDSLNCIVSGCMKADPLDSWLCIASSGLQDVLVSNPNMGSVVLLAQARYWPFLKVFSNTQCDFSVPTSIFHAAKIFQTPKCGFRVPTSIFWCNWLLEFVLVTAAISSCVVSRSK